MTFAETFSASFSAKSTHSGLAGSTWRGFRQPLFHPTSANPHNAGGESKQAQESEQNTVTKSKPAQDPETLGSTRMQTFEKKNFVIAVAIHTNQDLHTLDVMSF